MFKEKKMGYREREIERKKEKKIPQNPFSNITKWIHWCMCHESIRPPKVTLEAYHTICIKAKKRVWEKHDEGDMDISLL